MSKHSEHKHEKHEPHARKDAALSVINVGVCNSFHGSPGDQVNFATPSPTTTCNITQAANNTWPFTDGPPISVPPAGATTHIANLPNSVYRYNVDCCLDLSQKTLTIP
jgi:hypothetical protein